MCLSKVNRAQERFLHHKVAPQPQQRPELAKKMQNHPKISRFALLGHMAGYIRNQPLCFH